MYVETMKAQYAWYLRNCATGPEAAALQSILLKQLPRLDDAVVSNGGCDCRACAGGAADEKFKDETPQQRLRTLHLMLERYASIPSSDECFERTAMFAREEFSLDDIDFQILLLLLRYERNAGIERLANGVAHVIKNIPRVAAALIGVEISAVSARFNRGSPLLIQGIITVDEDDNDNNVLAGPNGRVRLSAPLRRTLYQPFASRQAWADAIIAPAQESALEWQDFEHLGAERDLAARLLSKATSGRSPGINLLLHGPVGTGKTEFSKLLAAEAGCTLWSIGEQDDEGGEPTRGERLASLRLAQRLLQGRAKAILLFDEAEDLLTRPSRSSGRYRYESKVFINRMIEENAVPVLWTCNGTDEIDDAVLRRMTLALEIKAPNRAVRARIWRNLFKKQKLEIADAAVHQLAARYETPPAVAATAARAAALADGGEAEVEQAMHGLLNLLGIGPSAGGHVGSVFDPALTNCATDIGDLADRLANPEAPRNWSMCIHGAPGTGKSEYARYLADRLGLEVTQKRASDLLSKWVGDSEKRIAAAFATARRERTMLIIDEADSLLFDRRDASRSWEVTQVNEMLTWMECHPFPFICTTNAMERLDQASLRRFTFKLRFDPLTPDQAARAFEAFFNLPAPARLPPGLSPGDFATVKRKRQFYRSADAACLVNWLNEEAEAKGAIGKPVGFRRKA